MLKAASSKYDIDLVTLVVIAMQESSCWADAGGGNAMPRLAHKRIISGRTINQQQQGLHTVVSVRGGSMVEWAAAKCRLYTPFIQRMGLNAYGENS
jgi:hypothetical protein